MNAKRISGIVMMILGASLAIFGALRGEERIINLGVCGTFIGAVLFSFSLQKGEVLIEAYHENLKNLARFFEVRKAIYIPESKNLKDGAVFLALKDDYDIDLAKMDYETILITGREKEAGILLKVPGCEVFKNIEDFSFESVSSALKSINLLKSAKVYETDCIKIFVEGVAVDFCGEYCRIVACPICANLILSVAKEKGELLEVESFRIGNEIEIRLKKIGGLEKWM